MIERLTEIYPCNKCNVEFCSRQCYSMTRWAESAKEKLAEYETAEDEGRFVVLPCKVGDTVYVLRQSWNGWNIDKKKFTYVMIGKVGKTVFITREEAEKALKEMEEKHE